MMPRPPPFQALLIPSKTPHNPTSYELHKTMLHPKPQNHLPLESLITPPADAKLVSSLQAPSTFISIHTKEGTMKLASKLLLYFYSKKYDTNQCCKEFLVKRRYCMKL